MSLSLSLTPLSSVGFRHFLHSVLTQLFVLNWKQLKFLLTGKQTKHPLHQHWDSCLADFK